jgi:hypothetical protein
VWLRGVEKVWVVAAELGSPLWLANDGRLSCAATRQ